MMVDGSAREDVTVPIAAETIEPCAADFRAVARADAGLFTHSINYPVAARLAVVAHRLHVRPTTLTLLNLVLGVGASAAVIALAQEVVSRRWLAVVLGVVAWLVWQLAYCFDCADGQLARVTGTATSAGGRLDVLCDVAVQVALVAAVIAAAAAARTGVPPWVFGVFAASWMVNLVTSVMAKEGTNVSLMASTSPAVRAVKLIRDYGFMLTVVAGALVIHASAMVWVMVLFAGVNGGFLLASIVQAARASVRGV
jgi:phosphatidylglycerophosphate synthase